MAFPYLLALGKSLSLISFSALGITSRLLGFHSKFICPQPWTDFPAFILANTEGDKCLSVNKASYLGQIRTDSEFSLFCVIRVKQTS